MARGTGAVPARRNAPSTLEARAGTGRVQIKWAWVRSEPHRRQAPASAALRSGRCHKLQPRAPDVLPRLPVPPCWSAPAAPCRAGREARGGRNTVSVCCRTRLSVCWPGSRALLIVQMSSTAMRLEQRMPSKAMMLQMEIVWTPAPLVPRGRRGPPCSPSSTSADVTFQAVRRQQRRKCSAEQTVKVGAEDHLVLHGSTTAYNVKSNSTTGCFCTSHARRRTSRPPGKLRQGR